jgi:hypothetical protein
MELTNKAKEFFEEWYLSNIRKLRSRSYDKLMVYQFYDLPLSMQWGVYLEWADSLGYYVNTTTFNIRNTMRCEFVISIEDSQETILFDTEYLPTRQEAQIETIKKLNDLINKSKKV